MNTAAMNLALAWQQRGNRAAAEMFLAADRPALFKPERVAELQIEGRRAVAWVGYWTGIGA